MKHFKINSSRLPISLFILQVLAVGVNATGQASARVAAFNDTSLSQEQYNKQGRRYSLNQKLTVNVPLSISTSIYIPGQWIDNAPGASGCTASPSAACSRVALIEIELGDGTGGSFTPTFYARMGFDNRNQSQTGSKYATAFLGGPITEDPSAYPNWPYSANGLYIDFPAGRTTGGWDNVLQRDAWNNFQVEIMLRDADPASPAPTYTKRGCKEILRVAW